MSKIIFNGVDYAGGSGNYFNPVIYSDTERKIGVWRDNKPMYAKTVHISALPSSAGSQQYPHNIANIDKVCHYESISRASSGTSVILNRVGLNGANFNGAVSYDVFVNTTVINITVGQDRSSIEADVTIWYTKTTDTAGSGDYNTYGVPTEHYDNVEKVAGTWYGETLYERSFVYTGNIANGAWKTVDNSYSPANIGVYFLEHICFKLSGLTTLYSSYGGQTLDVGIETTGKLYVENFTGETVTKVWLTIRYTKI